MKNKKLAVVIMLVLLATMLFGCAKEEAAYTSDTKTESKSMEMDTEEVEEAPMAFGDSDGNSSVEISFSEDMSADGQDTQMSSNTTDPAQALKNRKIIKMGYMYIESLEFDDTLEEIGILTDKYFGYFSSSESNGGATFENGYSTREATFQIKVPAENFELIYKELEEVGHVIHKNSGIEDITSQFVDVEARLTSLEIQEERLLAILEKTMKLDDIIELEYALQDVRYEIESYTSSLRSMEDRVRYSTLDIRIQEVYEETVIERPVITLGDRIASGFQGAIERIVDGFENVLVGIASNFLTIIIFGVIIFFVVRFVRKTNKKTLLKKAQKENDNTPKQP